MSTRTTYALADGLATIGMDDGKVNVMSTAMLREIHAAFDRAKSDRAAVLLTGRPGIFSAGFDLKVFMSGTAEDINDQLRAGAELAEHILGFPFPVVTACAGHAYPMGAFLMLAADLRYAADGPFRIGMNEVAIGITPPQFAIEIARQRLTPAAFNRVIVSGQLLPPAEAAAAGFVDHVVPAAELLDVARAAAAGLAKLDMRSHAATKLRVRGQALRALREAIDAELTLENARALVRARDGG
jgi:enoyl-CoA hydratase